MMQAAADAARNNARAEGRQAPLVIAVTVLTSMTAAAMSETGTTVPVIDQVSRLARLAHESGLDGVVASPQETSAIRALCGPEFVIVTPGIYLVPAYATMRPGAHALSGRWYGGTSDTTM